MKRILINLCIIAIGAVILAAGLHYPMFGNVLTVMLLCIVFGTAPLAFIGIIIFGCICELAHVIHWRIYIRRLIKHGF